MLVVVATFVANPPFRAVSMQTERSPQFILDGGPFLASMALTTRYLSWGSDTEIERLLDDAGGDRCQCEFTTFLSAVIGPTIWKYPRSMG